MRLKELKKNLPGMQVSRDRSTRTVKVEACGLGYRMTEAAFKNEAELAEHARSLVPAVTVRPG